MNDDLIKYIKLFLTDGIISKKEKEIIFRKSEELGVPQDECQMILDSLVYEAKAAKENTDEKKIVKTVKVFEQRKVKRIKPALLNQEVILKVEIDKSNKLIEKLIDETKEPMSKLNDLDIQISKKNETLQNLISHINDLERQLDKSTDLFFNKFKDEIFARFQSVPLYHNDHKMKGENFQAAKSVIKNGIAINAGSLFRSKLNSSQYQEKIQKYFLENFGKSDLPISSSFTSPVIDLLQGVYMFLSNLRVPISTAIFKKALNIKYEYFSDIFSGCFNIL